MPYDSNGVATINRQRAVTGQTVQAAQVNTPFDDTQSMLSQVLLRSGVAPMTGALNMNGNKQTNVGDPDADTDGANKEYVDAQVASINSGITTNARKLETVNANRLALLADKATSFRVTGSRTITLTAAATLLANWWCEVWAVDGQVTIDPDVSETINGNTTMILNAGQKAIVFCTGTVFFAFVTSDAQTGLQLEGYSFGLTLANNGVDPSNDIDVSSGKAASDTYPFNIMQLASPISKDVRFSWSVGTNQGGLDTGSVSDSTYYIWLIQRSDTLVTDVLFSLSNTSPTMPSGYSRKRLIGVFSRNSGNNSKPMTLAESASELKTWVNFDGTGTPPGIRASKNVASVARLATGLFRITFSTPMADTNYIAVGSHGGASGGYGMVVPNSLQTTTYIDVGCWGTGGAFVNPQFVNLIIVR